MNNNGYIFPDTSFDLDGIIKQARIAHTALFKPYAIIVPPFVKRQLIEEIKLTMTRFPADGLSEDIQICGLYIVPSDLCPRDTAYIVDEKTYLQMMGATKKTKVPERVVIRIV